MASYDERSQEFESAFKQLSLMRRIGLPSLGLRTSERRLLLRGIDVILLNVALIITLITSTTLLPSLGEIFGPVKWFITLTIVWFVVAGIFDVYNLARSASTTYSIRTIATAALISSGLYLAIPWFTPPIENRSQAFLFVFLAVGTLVIWRTLYAQLIVQPTFQRRAIIVGEGHNGQALISALQSEFARSDANPFRGTGYVLVGFIEDTFDATNDKVAGLPVLGNCQEMIRVVRRLEIDEVILAVSETNQMNPALLEAVLDCREYGVPVTKMTTVYELLTSRVPVEHARGDIEMAAGIDDNPFQRLYGALKRSTDLLGALVTIPILLLCMPIIAVANAIFAPGPLFFKQTRVGRSGRPFSIIKFRSMVTDAEKRGAMWAQAHDVRVTKIGRLLRWSHIDELPQIINVLRGEMSLVGPRPERPEFVEQLAPSIPFYRARHCTKPGITGWAQIHQDYGDTIEGAQEKLEYDLYYVKHASPILDMLIMLRTITKVVGLRGR